MLLSELEWTEWAAILGAITGIPAILIQIFQFWHSRPRLRVEIVPECAVFSEEFVMPEQEDDNSTRYKPATHIVITNTGQMAAAIIRLNLISNACRWYHRLFNKVIPFYDKKCMVISSQGAEIVKQSSKAPLILDAGHVWIGLIDASSFKDNMHVCPYIYLEIKVSYRNKPIRRKVKLRV